jgi:hypothetical protein
MPSENYNTYYITVILSFNLQLILSHPSPQRVDDKSCIYCLMHYTSFNKLNFFIYYGNINFTFSFPSECIHNEVNASNVEHTAKLCVLKIICTSRSVEQCCQQFRPYTIKLQTD